MKTNALRDLISLVSQLPSPGDDEKPLPIDPAVLLVAALAIEANPKLYPVDLPINSHRIYGLYSLNQSRRPGRRRDFTDVFRVGGLIVDKATPPSHGILEIVSVIDGPLDEAPPNLPWSVSQVLRTDGARWQALVLGPGGKWVTRESIDITPLFATPFDSHGEPSALLIEFAEFMRRALIRWEEKLHPVALAAYFASHAREEGNRLFREEAAFVDGFRNVLQREVGFQVQDPQNAAHCLTAIRVFELVYAGLTSSSASRTAFEASPAFRRFMQPSRPLTEALSFFLNTSPASFAFSEDMWENDHQLKEFCLCFINGALQSDHRLDGFTFKHMDAALSQAMDLSGVLPRDRGTLDLYDLNAGHGDYVLAALYTLPFNYKKVCVAACEANPLGAQIARLRLEAATQRPLARTSIAYAPGAEPVEKITRHKPTYEISIRLHNIYRDDFTGAPAERDMVLLGEIRPHITRGTTLSLGMSKAGEIVAEYGWGTRIHRIDHAADKYMNAVGNSTKRVPPLIACVRLPASWAEEPENVSARETLCLRMEDVFVNTGDMGERPRDKRVSRGDIVVLASSRKEAIKTRTPDTYTLVRPRADNGYSLLPTAVSAKYGAWVPLPELALRKPLNGPVERRGMSLIDMDRKRLTQRLNDYFSNLPNRALVKKHPELMTDTNLFDAVQTRQTLRREADYSPANIVDYEFRPFDVRYAYVKNMRPLFSDPANELFSLAWGGGLFLVVSKGTGNVGDGFPAWFGGIPCDYDFFSGKAGHFPVWIDRDRLPRGMTTASASKHIANLSKEKRRFLDRIGMDDPDESRDAAELLWLHTLAVLYTPAYIRENAEAIRLDWPRIPIPGLSDDRSAEEAKALLTISASLGREVAKLLAFDRSMRAEYNKILGGLVVNGHPASPDTADPNVLALTAGWGVQAKGKAVRPRPGRILPRGYRPGEVEALRELSRQMGVGSIDLGAVFGDLVGDAYLNDRACWSGIPDSVWEFRIGGRQVLPKWLSYREHSLINRSLTPDEVRFFNGLIVRVIKLTLLGVKLDRHWAGLR